MTTFGPLVRRSARWGGAVLMVGSVQFVVAMVVAQLRYPGYSAVANYISDLGNPSLSPAAWLFNDSIRTLGVLGVLAVLLIRSAFTDRFSSRLGLLALLIASVGAFLVGTYPEPSTELGGHIHAYVSLVTFLGSGISLLFFALAMLRDTRWEGFRGYTGLSGMVTLVALAVFAAWATNTGSAGLVERLIVAPILLWAFVAGLHLLRLRVFAPDRLLQHLSA